MNFPNGNTDDTDLEALEQQVNQIRESLESQEARENSNLTNGDIVMTEPSRKLSFTVRAGAEKLRRVDEQAPKAIRIQTMMTSTLAKEITRPRPDLK